MIDNLYCKMAILIFLVFIDPYAGCAFAEKKEKTNACFVNKYIATNAIPLTNVIFAV